MILCSLLLEKAPEMEKGQAAAKIESHLSSAAAFVEGGIQEDNGDACSICLEDFCESDPSTLTTCKHEFHLQCILEWCQRSSQCPMCWQSIQLKDPTSQELLAAVEYERNIRLAPPRHGTVFHHPTLGNFELQHLPMGATDADLEERIIQHLAAAAAVGRGHHHLGRRDGHRERHSSHNHPHFLVVSARSGTHTGPVSSPVSDDDPEEPVGVSSPFMSITSSSRDYSSRQISLQANPLSSSASGATVPAQMNSQEYAFFNRGSAVHPSSPIQDHAGPSDFQSFSESLKSKWNAVSMRYKESTRAWKEKFFSRSSSVVDLSPEVQREQNGRNHRVIRGAEQIEARENTRVRVTLESSDDSTNGSTFNAANQSIAENPGNLTLNDGNALVPRAAASLPTH
ncbi:hypothetical protein SAY87_018702 [Trapa incisa]|uniref:RING-type E3 ubiquitin transferase n=1 Tax=Trapa incisa TaxID=236973 RepID=A0AAN7K264_9MYRT|nr:hypothetical protein SAY87_018702 [Trapa incisa]